VICICTNVIKKLEEINSGKQKPWIEEGQTMESPKRKWTKRETHCTQNTEH